MKFRKSFCCFVLFAVALATSGSSRAASPVPYVLTEYTMNGCRACDMARKDVAELQKEGFIVRCVNTDLDPQAAREAEKFVLLVRPAWRLARVDGTEVARWQGYGRAAVIAATIRAKFPDAAPPIAEEQQATTEETQEETETETEQPAPTLASPIRPAPRPMPRPEPRPMPKPEPRPAPWLTETNEQTGESSQAQEEPAPETEQPTEPEQPTPTPTGEIPQPEENPQTQPAPTSEPEPAKAQEPEPAPDFRDRKPVAEKWLDAGFLDDAQNEWDDRNAPQVPEEPREEPRQEERRRRDKGDNSEFNGVIPRDEPEKPETEPEKRNRLDDEDAARIFKRLDDVTAEEFKLIERLILAEQRKTLDQIDGRLKANLKAIDKTLDRYHGHSPKDYLIEALIVIGILFCFAGAINAWRNMKN